VVIICPPSGFASNVARASLSSALGTLTFAAQHYHASISHIHSSATRRRYLVPLLLTHTIQILPIGKPGPSLLTPSLVSTHILPLLLLPTKQSQTKHTAFAITKSSPPSPLVASLTARRASLVSVMSAFTTTALTPSAVHASATACAGSRRLK
jgi:hypothetical protein